MNKDNLSTYKQPFRSEVVDLPALVESLNPLDDSLDYILAVKDSAEIGEFAHYSKAEIKQLKKEVDQAYLNLPDYVRPLIMNEMLSLWVQLSYL
ncbi:hypothetical protein HY494_02340 [Candidatus Woesearchaeota archaeon]|nr:hypothetical protein [Candidatus Woesearchaeota archaeon]